MKDMNVFRRLAKAAQLDDDLLSCVPLIEIAGENRVLIEHHMGVCAYNRESVRVRVKYGVVLVEGELLNLVHMKKDQIVICGKICSVVLERGGRDDV